MLSSITGLSWSVELNVANNTEHEVEHPRSPSAEKISELFNISDASDLFKTSNSVPPMIPLTVLAIQHRLSDHKCYRCGKRYSTKGTLNRHLRFECGQKPQFFCRLCNRPFTRNDTLMQHLKVMHPRSNFGVQ